MYVGQPLTIIVIEIRFCLHLTNKEHRFTYTKITYAPPLLLKNCPIILALFSNHLKMDLLF